MRYLTVQGKNDALLISKIAIGTDKFTAISEKEAFSLLDIYAEAGGNCIDTARVYCGGESEKIVGRWLKEHGRGNIALCTKGCHPPLDHMEKSRLTPADMRRDVEESLRALQTETIDLYWVHRDDPSIPAGEIIEGLNRFIREGKIRLIGCSNWKSERIAEANAYAENAGLSGFVSSQIQWSLAQTREEIYQDVGIVIMNSQEYGWYLEKQMPVFAYASQAQGFFSKMAAGKELSEKTRARFYSDENLKRLERVEVLAKERKVSVAAAALAYLYYNKLPTISVIGSKTEAQLRETLETAGLVLTAEEADALSKR